MGAVGNSTRMAAMTKSTQTREYRILRKTLARLREEAGLPQRALAKKLSVPHSWVAKVEAGERRIDFLEFCWFCEACGKDAAVASEDLIDSFGARRKTRAR